MISCISKHSSGQSLLTQRQYKHCRRPQTRCWWRRGVPRAFCTFTTSRMASCLPLKIRRMTWASLLLNSVLVHGRLVSYLKIVRSRTLKKMHRAWCEKSVFAGLVWTRSHSEAVERSCSKVKGFIGTGDNPARTHFIGFVPSIWQQRCHSSKRRFG